MNYLITEVQIIPIKPNNGLVAFATVVLNDCLFLGSIGIHTKLDGTGLRLTYPTKKVGIRDMNIYHPLNNELSSAVESAVFTKFKNVMNKYNDRHCNFGDS